MKKYFPFLLLFLGLNTAYGAGNPVNYIAKLEEGTRYNQEAPAVIKSCLIDPYLAGQENKRYAPNQVALCVISHIDHPHGVKLWLDPNTGMKDIPQVSIKDGHSVDAAISLLYLHKLKLKNEPRFSPAPQKGKLVRAPYLLVEGLSDGWPDVSTYRIVDHFSESDHNPQSNNYTQVFFLTPDDLEGSLGDSCLCYFDYMQNTTALQSYNTLFETILRSGYTRCIMGNMALAHPNLLKVDDQDDQNQGIASGAELHLGSNENEVHTRTRKTLTRGAGYK